MCTEPTVVGGDGSCGVQAHVIKGQYVPKEEVLAIKTPSRGRIKNAVILSPMLPIRLLREEQVQDLLNEEKPIQDWLHLFEAVRKFI